MAKNQTDQNPEGSKADTALRPALYAAVTFAEFRDIRGEVRLSELVEALDAQAQAAERDDKGRAIGMLNAQAHSLDAIFHKLARLAANSKSIDHLEQYLKLAFRAQSQCRMTWEAIGTLKRPPIMGYVNQANIAHGPQQVNNAPIASPCKRGDRNPQNELFEESDGKRLDTGATGAASGSDPQMAPVGECDRSEDASRKGGSF